MTIKLAIGGDVHGNINQVKQHLKAAKAKDVTHYFQVGDWNLTISRYFIEEIERLASQFGITVYWLDGNHDDFPFIHAMNPEDNKELIKISKNVFYMPRNLQFELDGLKFHIIGGAHSIDEKFRTYGEDLYREEDISPKDVDYALTLPQADILLSHDCPTTVENPITSDHVSQRRAAIVFGEGPLQRCRNNQDLLTKITNHIDPALIFHGHYHHYYTRYGCNPITGRRFLTTGLNEGSYLDSLFISDTDQLREMVKTVDAYSI